MNTRTYYIARHNFLGFADFRANTLEGLHQEIEKNHTYKPTMSPENFAYWQKVKAGLKIYKVTEILEEVDFSNTDEA